MDSLLSTGLVLVAGLLSWHGGFLGSPQAVPLAAPEHTCRCQVEVDTSKWNTHSTLFLGTAGALVFCLGCCCGCGAAVTFWFCAPRFSKEIRIGPRGTAKLALYEQ